MPDDAELSMKIFNQTQLLINRATLTGKVQALLYIGEKLNEKNLFNREMLDVFQAIKDEYKEQEQLYADVSTN